MTTAQKLGGNMFLGIVLVIIGAIILLGRMGIIHNYSFWGFLWPALIVAIGVKLITDKPKKS